jgi:hypothetical protein
MFFTYSCLMRDVGAPAKCDQHRIHLSWALTEKSHVTNVLRAIEHMFLPNSSMVDLGDPTPFEGLGSLCLDSTFPGLTLGAIDSIFLFGQLLL